MSPPVDSIVPSEKLPSEVDVVVIGGGIIGVSTALFLARKGLTVLVCEKGRVGGEQSSRNWGWCRAMGRDFREIPLILESLRIWRGLGDMVGHDLGYRQCGILYLCETKADMEGYGPWLDHSERYQIGSRLITPAQVQELIPGFARKIEGALYTATDGRAEPSRAAPGIARAVQALGGSVVTDCAVRTIERSGGRVSGVVTERGTVRCRAAVLAGGAWSRLFAGNLGIDLPQLRVRSSVLRTTPVEGGPETSVYGDFAFRRRMDGGYSVAHGGVSISELTPEHFSLFGAFLPAAWKERKSLRLSFGKPFFEALRTPKHWRADEVTPFERTRVLDPAPSPRVLDEAMARFRASHPAFAKAQVAESWAGMIDVTPDAVPVISEIDTTPGFFIATGFSGHGFGIGPGAGKLMADLVAGDDPVVDPAPFRFNRFRDGTKIVLDAGF